MIAVTPEYCLSNFPQNFCRELWVEPTLGQSFFERIKFLTDLRRKLPAAGNFFFHEIKLVPRSRDFLCS